MIGVLAVADYREFESWRRARFAVCAALDFAKSIPRLHGRKNLVDEINRLSVSILDTLSRGLERGGDSAFIEKALEKHNIIMTWPSNDQVIRLSDMNLFDERLPEESDDTFQFARLERMIMNE